MSLEFRRTTAIHCDNVFDVLTRGPFPTGHESDAAVERHLAGCHECRELAEALSPAVQLFHEALAPSEGQELPGYRGVYSSARVVELPSALRDAMFGDTPAAPLASPGTCARRQDRPWRLAAALGWGTLVAMLLLGAVWQTPRALFTAVRSTSANDTRAVKFQPSDSGREWLFALHLPSACLHAPPLSATSSEVAAGISQAKAGYDCCLKCHGQSSANRPALDTQATLDRTCHVCHNY